MKLVSCYGIYTSHPMFEFLFQGNRTTRLVRVIEAQSHMFSSDLRFHYNRNLQQQQQNREPKTCQNKSTFWAILPLSSFVCRIRERNPYKIFSRVSTVIYLIIILWNLTSTINFILWLVWDSLHSFLYKTLLFYATTNIISLKQLMYICIYAL